MEIWSRPKLLAARVKDASALNSSTALLAQRIAGGEEVDEAEFECAHEDMVLTVWWPWPAVGEGMGRRDKQVANRDSTSTAARVTSGDADWAIVGMRAQSHSSAVLLDGPDRDPTLPTAG